MSYTLKFSDLTKTDTVVVPDMPPGINTVDTSLNLVGRGYPNYGEKIAENFLHLLENFSSAVPPENPIEGQLWYDTSDPARKVLRVMDGTATSARWPSANGIYQQSTDPRLSATSSVRKGDIWVDTASNQLKIYTSDDWTTVGPTVGSGTEKTGAEVYALTDSANTTVQKRVILNWSGGYVVAVISGYPEFTPQTYPSGMEGFSIIKPGITLTTRAFPGFAQLVGTAENATKLDGFSATNYLLKSDNTLAGQKITGKVVFETPNQPAPEGRDGVVIRVAGSPSSEYVQFYKFGNDAVITNNVTDGKIIFKTKGSLVNTISVSKNAVAINTTTVSTSPTFEVYGTAKITNTLTVADLTVSNDIVANNLTANGAIDLVGITTSSGNLHMSSHILANSTSTYDIGTLSKPFRAVYATSVYSSNYSSTPGTLKLHAGSTATSNIPSGWLVCNGSTATTATYANLFTAIGYTYGQHATGAFYLPNMFVQSVTAARTTASYYIIKT